MTTKTPVNPVTLCAMGTDGKLYPVLLDPSSQSLKVETTLEVGDIEIGGVEIKNGADDTRAVVTSGAAPPATTDNALVAAIADGKHITVGAKADAAQTDPSEAASLISLVKGLFTGIVLKAGSAIIGKVGIDQTAPGTTNGVVAAPSADQDPIFDHDNAPDAFSVTGAAAAVQLILPPAGCKFVRITSDLDVRVTNHATIKPTAVKGVVIRGGTQGEPIPVTASVPVWVYAASTATVSCTPFKARS